MQTGIFYIMLKILSFDSPEKKYERRIMAGFYPLEGWGESPPTGG